MTKTVYELKVFHHKRAYRKGDLEDETIIINSQIFPTRTKANDFLITSENTAKRNKHKTNITLVKRGDKPSELLEFTGDSWVNENSGETHNEYYHYVVNKQTI